MAKRITITDKIGNRYGKWVIIDVSDVRKNGHIHFTCECDCGTIKAVNWNSLKLGLSKSCRCACITHGKSGTKIYDVWSSMSTKYIYTAYTVCEEWKSFDRFYKDMGDIPKGMKYLNRVDCKNKVFCKDNCKWGSKPDSFHVKTLTYDGDTRTYKEWSIEKNISLSTIYHRVRVGRPISEILQQ